MLQAKSKYYLIVEMDLYGKSSTNVLYSHLQCIRYYHNHTNMYYKYLSSNPGKLLLVLKYISDSWDSNRFDNDKLREPKW